MLCLRHYPTPTSRCSYSTIIVYISNLVVEESLQDPKDIAIFTRGILVWKLPSYGRMSRGTPMSTAKWAKAVWVWEYSGRKQNSRAREFTGENTFGCGPCVFPGTVASAVAEVGFLFCGWHLKNFARRENRENRVKITKNVKIHTLKLEDHEKRENSHPGRWKTWTREISHPGPWKSRKTWKFTPWTVKDVKTWKFTPWSVKNVKIHICKRENTIWLRKSDLDSEMQKQGPGRYGLGFRSRMVP